MDKNTPFPECAKNCEVVKMLGAGECESVCGHKFDTSGRQLTIPDVSNSVCDHVWITHYSKNYDYRKCELCHKVEQTDC
ncbi:MAG: hypothetical protein WCT77_03650 [Bacteroidota bacterium]|jgi:hypothetical protein